MRLQKIGGTVKSRPKQLHNICFEHHIYKRLNVFRLVLTSSGAFGIIEQIGAGLSNFSQYIGKLLPVSRCNVSAVHMRRRIFGHNINMDPHSSPQLNDNGNGLQQPAEDSNANNNNLDSFQTPPTTGGKMQQEDLANTTDSSQSSVDGEVTLKVMQRSLEEMRTQFEQSQQQNAATQANHAEMMSSLNMLLMTLVTKVPAHDEADTASQVPQSEKEASVLPTSNISNNLAASKAQLPCYSISFDTQQN